MEEAFLLENGVGEDRPKDDEGGGGSDGLRSKMKGHRGDIRMEEHWHWENVVNASV